MDKTQLLILKGLKIMLDRCRLKGYECSVYLEIVEAIGKESKKWGIIK